MRRKSGLSLAGSASRPIRRSSSDSNFSVTIRCRDGSAVAQGSEVSLRSGRVSAFQPGTGMIGRPLVARERTLHLQEASKGLLIVFFRGIYLYRLTIVGGDRERSVCPSRRRRQKVCARGAWWAPLSGPSTAPLGRRVSSSLPCSESSRDFAFGDLNEVGFHLHSGRPVR